MMSRLANLKEVILKRNTIMSRVKRLKNPMKKIRKVNQDLKDSQVW